MTLLCFHFYLNVFFNIDIYKKKKISYNWLTIKYIYQDTAIAKSKTKANW